MGHDHDHHGHHHTVPAGASSRWISVALALIVAFLVVEIIAGLISGSLALLTDAAHMSTDAAALLLALVAVRLAARPARGAMTYGLPRAEVLSAHINGAALLALGAVLGVEAIRRLGAPPDVDGMFVIVIGTVGALVNVGSALALARAGGTSLAVAGAMAHVLADLWASLAAIAAGMVIVAFGWPIADPIASLLVSALMIRSGAQLLLRSGRVLMEAAPKGVDVDVIHRTLRGEPGVVDVHDLHVWELTHGFAAASAHVLVGAGEDCHRIRRSLAGVLARDFQLEHVTLQVDHGEVTDSEDGCRGAHGCARR